MQTTLIGQKTNSNMQLMGETREPMALDCWTDAQRLAEKYSKELKRDFWVLFAAKPHVSLPRTIVAGWDVVAARPPAGMVGVLVFKWDHKEKALSVDEALSLPPDVPLSDVELSNERVPSLEQAARRSGSILLS